MAGLEGANFLSADSYASRIWRETLSPPLYMAGAAMAKPLALAAPTLTAGGRALVAAADTAVVARGLMYTSVRQASSDLACAVPPVANRSSTTSTR